MWRAQGPFFTFDPRRTGLSGTPEIRFSPDGRTIAVLSLLGEGSDAKSGGSTGDDAHSSKPFYMGSSVIMLDAFATGEAGAVRCARGRWGGAGCKTVGCDCARRYLIAALAHALPAPSCLGSTWRTVRRGREAHRPSMACRTTRECTRTVWTLRPTAVD